MILLDYKEVLFELMEKFEAKNIDEITLKSGDIEIKMKKNKAAVQIPDAPVIKNENIMLKPTISVKEEITSALAENERIIKAPMIGTYYSAPSPEAEDFVFIGKKVKKGDILCIISAMKSMNDIESELDGEIIEIYHTNDSIVEYGADLFKIKIN